MEEAFIDHYNAIVARARADKELGLTEDMDVNKALVKLRLLINRDLPVIKEQLPNMKEGEVHMMLLYIGLPELVRIKNANELDRRQCIFVPLQLSGPIANQAGFNHPSLQKKYFTNGQRRYLPDIIVCIKILSHHELTETHVLFPPHPMPIPPMTRAFFEDHLRIKCIKFPSDLAFEMMLRAMPHGMRTDLQTEWNLTLRKCAHCKCLKPKMNVCSRCKKYALCSEACQKSFWVEGGHSKNCIKK